MTIGKVATLLGVHRNTVRNRIRVGRYTARKVVTPQGETYVVARDSLEPIPDNGHAHPLTAPVHHNPYQGAPDVTAQEAQAEALVQRLLAPFVHELGAVREELGRVKAERDQLQARVAALEGTGRPETRPQVREDLAAETDALRPASAPWWRFRGRW